MNFLVYMFFFMMICKGFKKYFKIILGLFVFLFWMLYDLLCWFEWIEIFFLGMIF